MFSFSGKAETIAKEIYVFIGLQLEFKYKHLSQTHESNRAG